MGWASQHACACAGRGAAGGRGGGGGEAQQRARGQRAAQLARHGGFGAARRRGWHAAREGGRRTEGLVLHDLLVHPRRGLRLAHLRLPLALRGLRHLGPAPSATCSGFPRPRPLRAAAAAAAAAAAEGCVAGAMWRAAACEPPPAPGSREHHRAPHSPRPARGAASQAAADGLPPARAPLCRVAGSAADRR